MADNKTRPTEMSVEQYVGAIENESRRGECEALLMMMRKVTRQPARMWGSSIVGFGSYHYVYESGREGDMCRTGFSSRKNDLVVYLVASGVDQDALLEKLGKHKMGKSCVHIKRLSDIDMKVLRQLIVDSLAEVKRRYG